MKVEAITFQRLPDRTHGNLAFRYVVGYTPMDAAFWWSDFVIKEITLNKDDAVSHAKHLQDRLKRGIRLMPELDSTRLWRVCIVDIFQPGKEFSED